MSGYLGEAPFFCSGATGYIGAAVLRSLLAAGFPVLGGVRRAAVLPPGAREFITGDLAQQGLNLPEVSAVVHAAGLGHRRGISPETWERENVTAAANLARAARAAGAKRFIMISTAHVYGRVHAGVVTDGTALNPMDMYARSKLMAEHVAAEEFGEGFCAVRPVAVIGPGCPGNISTLLKLLRQGVPLPLGGIVNRRSFIGRDDLAALVLALLRANDAPGTVLAAHPQTVSTPDLVRALAGGLGVRARVWPCPASLLAAVAARLGREALWQSVSGSFAADPAAALSLGWRPAVSLVECLRDTSRYYDTT